MNKIYCIGNPDYIHPYGEVVHHVNEIPNYFPKWLRDADIEWCVVSFDYYNDIIWHDGVWKNGVWEDGEWWDGV